MSNTATTKFPVTLEITALGTTVRVQYDMRQVECPVCGPGVWVWLNKSGAIAKHGSRKVKCSAIGTVV